MNWRKSYQETYCQHRSDLTRQRRAGEARRVYLPGLQRSRRVCDLTDRQIENVARREAEIDVQHAINEHNSHATTARRRMRAGQAF